MSLNPIVILGGGISGLSCAFYLHKWIGHMIAPRKIIIIESSKHLGGWIMTKTFDDGVVYEIGPKSIRAQGAKGFNTLSFVEEIGLAKEVIGVPITAPAAHKRHILANGTLHMLPSSPSQLFSKIPYLKRRLFSYILNDYRTPKVDINKFGGDISVHDYIKHRMGEDIANYYFDPICKGITAGDSKKLSFISAFPDMFQHEQSNGSLIMGLFPKPHDLTKYLNSDLATFARSKRWTLWSFNKGLQTLPDKLCEFLLNIDDSPIEIYNESKVTHIEFDKNSSSHNAIIKVKTHENEVIINADYVFSALPAQALANVLPHSEYSKLCNTLNEISAVNVAVVNLEYAGKLLPPDFGFGFLAPSVERAKILGIICDSCVFPNFNAGKDITRITVMMGGEWFEDLFGDIDTIDESKILSTAIDSARKYLKINDDPIRYIVSLNKNCIPQYYIGHQKLMETIDNEIKDKNLNMSLIGASYNGVSVNDCIYNSKIAAERFAKSMGAL